MAVVQSGHEAWQQIRRYCGQYAKPERACQRVLFFGYYLFYPSFAFQHGLSLFCHEPAGSCRFHPLRRTFEQAYAKLVFKFAYHGAECGLCHSAFFCSLGEVLHTAYGRDVLHLL
jgi:hypothetical protein